MIKIASLFNLPAPYTAPLYRKLHEDKDIEFIAFFCWKMTENEENFDKAQNRVVKWNIPLTKGYNHIFLKNLLHLDSSNPLGMVNPEIKKYIHSMDFDGLFIGTSYWSPTTWMAIRACRKKGIKLITRATVEKGRKRNLIVRIIKKIVVTHYCSLMSAGLYECAEQKEYLMQYGMKENKLFFSPCAVDNDFFQSEKRKYIKSEEKMRLGFDPNTIVISYAGSLTERKRPLDLLMAYNKVKSENYNIGLIFIGDGVLRPEIENVIADEGIENVRICGFINQDKISRYYSASDIFVMASRNDASPKALNEAMNFGLPIIISDQIGTAKELLEEGLNGYKFHVGNIEELAECIRKLCKKPDEIEKMGHRSEEIVKVNSFTEVIESWKKAVQEVKRLS